MATCAVQRAGSRTRRPGLGDDPILATKIAPPDGPDWAVQRPRITTLIAERRRSYPLTLVTGPVGAGKTMALAQWAAAEATPVVWVGLEGYHNRPGVFLSYLVAALRRAGVAVPSALPAARGRAGEDLFLLRLAAELARRQPPVTLVLDDFHIITEPRILNGLDFLVRNVGPSLRVVLSSRSDPPLRLHRYRLVGQLAEISAGDLAFTVDEADLLLARHGCTLSTRSLKHLVQQTEGWPAGLRLAAICLTAHPDPDRYVADLPTQDSALTSFLAEEVLKTQPPEVREVLLRTCILERVNGDAITAMTGDEQACRTLQALVQGNVFVQPVGGGWYRYHPLFAHMLRREVIRESPARIAALHRQAARWCQRDGRLTDALRHATRAGDWQLAAGIVVDELGVSEILEPKGGSSPADELADMPLGRAWSEPQPYLVGAAIALSTGQIELALAGLDAADGLLEQLPADDAASTRFAAALIRLALARRTGDFDDAVEAAARADVAVSKAASETFPRPGMSARVLCARGTVELWSGQFEEAVRLLGSGVLVTAPGCEDVRAACLGHLGLAEALRGRLRRAAVLADQAIAAGPATGQRPPAQYPNPAALLASAWVHLQHHELNQTRDRLEQANSALAASPDKLLHAIACLVDAYSALVTGRNAVAVQSVTRARAGWQVPTWLEHELSLVEVRASVAEGTTSTRPSAAERAGQDGSPLASLILAHARMAAGDGADAWRAVENLLATHARVPDRVRLQAWLVDARLSYQGGDWARGRRSLGRALLLAEHEQLRLPFALDRSWIEPVLRRDPQLGHTFRHLLPSAGSGTQLPAPTRPANPAVIAAVEPLTEREREVLRHISSMLTTAEIATELYISANTVKSHVKNVCRKLSATHRGEAVRKARQLQLI